MWVTTYVIVCVPREPLSAHLAALHEPVPAQRLRHGPACRGRDHPGLRQRQDVPRARLRRQAAPRRTGLARVRPGEEANSFPFVLILAHPFPFSFPFSFTHSLNRFQPHSFSLCLTLPCYITLNLTIFPTISLYLTLISLSHSLVLTHSHSFSQSHSLCLSLVFQEVYTGMENRNRQSTKRKQSYISLTLSLSLYHSVGNLYPRQSGNPVPAQSAI